MSMQIIIRIINVHLAELRSSIVSNQNNFQDQHLVERVKDDRINSTHSKVLTG